MTGGFLLFKATRELHGRIEGALHSDDRKRFISALGGRDTDCRAGCRLLAGCRDHGGRYVRSSDCHDAGRHHVAIVMIMMWASKPLTLFINRHPTLVILCLGFLLMIGFSLMADGLGFHVPKGYLYAAIGFSILIEFFNQLARMLIMKNYSKVNCCVVSVPQKW